MSQDVTSLLKENAALKQAEPFAVKTGEIIYAYYESVTDKFQKISVGIDCSEIIHGKMFKGYLAFDVTNYSKEMMLQFDPRQDDPENNFYPSKTRLYSKGDIIKVMVDPAAAFSTNVDKKNDGRTAIYNNIALIKVKIVKKATPVSESDALGGEAPPPPPPAADGLDDLPF